MLQSGKSESWERALWLAADRRQGGVLIHCQQGKDRTGVLAALLQHAAGDLEQEIVSGYAASEALLEDRPREESAQEGVDWSALRGSPPVAMTETLQWIRKTYGAIDLFLEGAGCGDDWRDVLLAPPALHGRSGGWS